MALNKVINDANQKFEPVTTETLVFDAVPTVNSFNSVTSDGVARAIAGASGEVPQVTESDNGKVLTAVYDAGGAAVEWAEASGGLPASLGTAGQVLTVNSGATGVEWATPSSGGGDAFVATYGTTTNAEVLAAWDAGKAVFAQRIFGGNSPALYAFATKRDMNTGAFVFMCQTIDTSASELDISIWTLSYQNQWSDTSWSISVTQ